MRERERERSGYNGHRDEGERVKLSQGTGMMSQWVFCLCVR